jgi:hypothetical protein
MDNVRRFLGAGLLLVAVAGCSTTKEMDLPGGGKAYSLSCEGSETWNKCLSKAHKVCDSGYEIVSATRGGGSSDPLPAPPNSSKNYPQPYSQRTIVIKCL